MNLRRTLLFSGALAATLGAIAYAQSPGVNSPYNPVWSIPLDSIKRTYGISIAQLSPSAATTNDIFQVCGNANVVTRITRFVVSGRATAAQSMDLVVVKRSGQDLGGTVVPGGPFNGVSQVGIPFDANTSAALSFATAYQAAPTNGAVVGNLAALQLFLGNATTGQPGPTAVFDFGNRPSSAVVLRSPTQCASVNLSSGGLAGNLLDITAEWTEE